MKFKFLILSAISLFIISCGGDDCTQTDWVGTYVGEAACPDQDVEAETIVITAGSSEDEILINGDPATINGCQLTLDITDPFFGLEISTNFELDGNVLSSTAVTDLGGGTTITCTFEGTK